MTQYITQGLDAQPFKNLNCIRMRNRSFVTLILLLLTVGQLFAQKKLPVHTITTVSAPYPVSLDQYAGGLDGKISLTIIPKDVFLQNYPVKLRLVITGGWFKIYSNPDWVHKDILLNNGETMVLSAAELSEWFNPDNLIFEGFSKNQYLKTGRLPEGNLQVWFDVYESNYNYVMSSSAKAMIWLFENEPPFLNLPNNTKELAAVDPQNIVFNWTQRQAPFSTAGSSNEYKLELWEIWPDNLNAEDIVRSTKPLFSSDPLNSTSFVYTSNEPILIIGRRYAWRVQVYDPNGKTRFKNNGYSEVRWFRFGKECGVPTPLLDKTTPTSIAIKWEGNYQFEKYELRYRNKGRANANWYTQDASGMGAAINNLKTNTEYEIQLRGYCGGQEGNYSSTLTARTKQELTFKCGATPGVTDTSKHEPLPALRPGDYFRIGDFDVQVFQASGASGTFSGQGFALVPLLKSIKFQVDFKGIQINSDYQMYGGEVNFVYDKNNGLLVNLSKLLEGLTSSNDNKVIETNPYDKIADKKASIDTTISAITVLPNGDIKVETSDGHTNLIRASKGDMVAISGKSEGSEQYVADTKTGTLYKGSPEKSTAGNSKPQQPLPTNKPVKNTVMFLPHLLEVYGMDIPNDKIPPGNYDKVTVGGQEILVPWKSVETGHIDRLMTATSGSGGDSINFLTESGNMVMTAPGSKEAIKEAYRSTILNSQSFKQILVTGVDKSDMLKAWYSEKVNDSIVNRILAGQVNIVAYDKIPEELCLVEVNGAVAPEPDFVEKELNIIYSSSIVQWKVSKLSSFKATLDNYSGIFENIHDEMKYTSHEKQVKDAFMNAKDYNKNKCYLFFIKGETKKDIQGFMPYNRQFGFLYTENLQAADVMHTIAHELGHGLFRLEHPYKVDDPRMSTEDNLMAYNQSTHLFKSQWDLIHDPQSMLFAWAQDEEEGALAAVKEYYFTIDGKKALEIDIEALEAEFNNTKTLSNEELNSYSFKTIQVYVMGTENNDYKISTMYTRNGENKGEAPGIVWDVNGAKEKEIQFRNKYIGKESGYIYYTSPTVGTFPVYNVEIVRVAPNIAYKQEGETNCIIREDKKTYDITNEIELSGDKVSLRPVFLTYDEKNDDVEDITALFNRNQQCVYLVNTIKFGDKAYDPELTLDWIEYELSTEESIYEISIGEETVKGIIKTAGISPFVTIIRGKSNEETGYYIEDYYSTAFGGTSAFPSLRDQNNTMKTGGFDVLGSAYKIPIVHYKSQCNVKLLLADIPRNETPSPLQYKIGDQTIELGKEFTIQTPPNGTILDIKDVDGNIKGKVEFRQINESLLTPTLNIVTINAESTGIGLSTVISDVNAIYNTINVAWQEGKHIVIKVNPPYSLNVNSNLTPVLNALKAHSEYKANQYYMIISSEPINASGYTGPTLDQNWFVMQATYDKRVSPHELGHCSGIDEYAVNIGLLPSSRRNESSQQNMQYLTTNIMGYSDKGFSNANPLLDFYSWQISLVRERISIRINTK